MQHAIRINPTARPVADFLRKWGPYLLPAILLPGGIVVALLMLIRRRRLAQSGAGAAPAPAIFRKTPGRARSIAVPARDSRAVPASTPVRAGRFARHRVRALTATTPSSFH